ncbi:MAG: NADH-quinone oxidoreductase subunit K [Anaerolineae bacterium]|nr:NADH-quinone oxidoreductase subunit K [Anaerolineae bacterium]
MITWTPATVMVLGVIGLLAVGLYGLLTVRNLFQIIVALQILVKGAVLALVAAADYVGQLHLGQSLAVTVIVADTVVAVIGMAMAVQVKQHNRTLDVKALGSLRR